MAEYVIKANTDLCQEALAGGQLPIYNPHTRFSKNVCLPEAAAHSQRYKYCPFVTFFDWLINIVLMAHHVCVTFVRVVNVNLQKYIYLF